MSRSDLDDDVNRKKLVTANDFPHGIDYKDLAALQEHVIPALRRGQFASQLAQVREQAGFSPASLAAALNVKQPSIKRWETGETSLSWLDARRIAAVLRCAPHDLFDDPSFRATASARDEVEPHPDPPPTDIPGAHWWRVHGSALALSGILDGDLIAVGGYEYPGQGALVVIARARPDGSNWNGLRMRSGDYFVGHSAEAMVQPIPMEAPGVAVRGAVKALFRLIN